MCRTFFYFIHEIVLEDSLELLHLVCAYVLAVADVGSDVFEVQNCTRLLPLCQQFVGCQFVLPLDHFIRVLDLLLQEVEFLDADLLLV